MSNDSAETSPDRLTVDSAPQPQDDSPLLALERQFNAISAELLAMEPLRHDQRGRPAAVPERPEQPGGKTHPEERTCDETATCRIEAVLVQLYPIERAIMQTPAWTLAGLGVKARHAAHVMSQYWEEPLDQIDWEAQAVRCLIEAVCDVAGTPSTNNRGMYVTLQKQAEERSE